MRHLLFLALTLVACAPAPSSVQADYGPVVQTSAQQPILLASADVGMAVRDWYSQSLLQQPVTPGGGSKFATITVTGLATASKFTATSTTTADFTANAGSGQIALQLQPGGRIDFGAAFAQFYGDGSGNPTFSASAGPIQFASFTDGSGTTGSQTLNTTRGIAAFAAASSSITITNSRVTAQSTVLCVLQTNDATAVLKNCVPAAGSFTINLTANATGTTKVSFLLFGS